MPAHTAQSVCVATIFSAQHLNITYTTQMG